MCIKNCLIISIILLIYTQINLNVDAINYDNLFSSHSISNYHTNESMKMPFVFFNKNKHTIYRDINNHNNRITHYEVSTTKPPRILPKIPSLYLEPPTITKYYWNDELKKNSFKEKLKNINITKNHDENRPSYIRDHDPSVVQGQQDVLQITDTGVRKKKKIKEENKYKKNRVNFHVHGHQGPDSYIFGYDTGSDGQFRLEEKHENGTVTGYYGYHDARGRLRKINYSSDPANGYQEESTVNGHSLGQ